MKSRSVAARPGYPILVFLALLALLLALTLGVVGGQSATAASPPAMVKVFVAFDCVPGLPEQALVRAVGGEIRHTYTIVPALSASIPEAALAGLEKNPRVVRIEPVLEVYAIDAELDNTWGVKKIGAGLVHDLGTTGAGVEVAVIDSGIDYTHPDLDANYAGGYDFVNEDPYPMDDNGHGTHVAGTIAAEDNGTGVVGVAPGAQVYGLKVLGADGSGSYDDIVAALDWIVAQNAMGATNIQVTNNSYGSSGDPGETVRQAFDSSYAAGVLHIAAAGNSGNPAGRSDSVIYPARYASAVAVAAVDSSDARASFSSTGPDVEVAAPGVAIPSTVPGGGYESWSGTSMASPHVAGTAALLIASGGATTHEAIRLRLQETAVDLGTAGHDWKYGYGRVDAATAVGVPIEEPDTTPPAAPTGLAASAGDSQVSLDWADNSESDLAGYNLYRSTTSGGGYAQVNTSLVTSSTLTDTGLTNGTTYYYVVAAVDATGNESAYSNEASATPTAGSSTPGTIGATDITFATEGGRYGTAHLLIGVVIEDTSGQPIANASVTISVRYPNGATSSYNGTSGSNGATTFKITNAPSGSYTVTVTNVSASGLTWDGSQHSETWTKP